MQIVVVDNDTSLLQSLRIILRRKGYAVHCFADPSDALKAVERGLAPDILLVDLVMQGMTGLVFLAAVSPILPGHCRKAIITGHAERLSEDDLASVNVEALFPKPLDLSSIISFLNASSLEEVAIQDCGREQ